MAVERNGEGSVRVLDSGTLVAEGTSVPDSLAMELPYPVSIPEDRTAGARCRLRAHPEEHPFPTCFVCGPDRGPGDGLHILVGPDAGRDLSANLLVSRRGARRVRWPSPARVLVGGVDCAGGIGALGDAAPNGLPFVLSRLSARQIAPVKTSEPHIVAGWRLAKDGRKMTAGSALFTAAGQAVGVARATWIRLPSRSSGPPDAHRMGVP